VAKKIIWSADAKNDLNLIWLFYAEKSFEVADKVIDEIIFTAESINFSEQFQLEPTFSKIEFRRAICRHFKIIYSVRENKLFIVRIFDSRQNPKKLKP